MCKTYNTHICVYSVGWVCTAGMLSVSGCEVCMLVWGVHTCGPVAGRLHLCMCVWSMCWEHANGGLCIYAWGVYCVGCVCCGHAMIPLLVCVCECVVGRLSVCGSV